MNCSSDQIESVLKLLNELAVLDREAVENLIETRVVCNSGMADHPTVQVSKDKDGTTKVGILGIINGILGVQPEGANKPGWGYIAAVFNDSDGKFTNFVRIDAKNAPAQ